MLGMGDVVSLVERAAETIQMEEAEAFARKMAKGQFDLNDLRAQMNQMRRMGGLGALASMLPGVKQVKQAMASGAADDKILVRMDAIISSMTPKERTRPELLNAKRKIRVAKGSGTTVQDVNKVLKMHQDMSTAMKRLKKMGGLKSLAGLLGGKGGLGAMMGGGAGEMPGLPGGGAGGGMGLPGLPGGGGNMPFNLPPGFDKFIKK
jgi:signal recognition particle subunit SRP54